MSIPCTIPTEVKMNIIKLRLKAKLMEPIARIGKNGLTDSVIEEIKKLLRKRGLVKIRILKPAFENMNKKEVVKELVDKTDAVLIESVGFVVVLSKK